MRRGFTYLMLLASLTFLQGQETPSVEVDTLPPVEDYVVTADRILSKSVISTDSLFKNGYQTAEPVYSHQFRKDFQKHYSGEAYDYEQILPKKSLWDRFEDWLGRFFDRLFDKIHVQDIDRNFIKALRIVGILALAVVLYFTFRYFMAKNGNWVFNRRVKNTNPAGSLTEEELQSLDLENLIRQAENGKDYRTATRYRFLQILQKLVDQKLIGWDPEKTNRDYLKEVKDPKIHGDFKKLIYIFENVWYGERTPDLPQYEKFKDSFNQMLRKL